MGKAPIAPWKFKRVRIKKVKRPDTTAETGPLLPFQPALTQCLAVDQH